MFGRKRIASQPAEPRSPNDRLDRLDAIEFKDKRVARAMYCLPWEQFDPAQAAVTAERMTVLIRMLEALELRGTEHVLDIGTGAGYRAALLSRLAKRVQSIELVPGVAVAARHKLSQLGCNDVEVFEGDGSRGWARGAPYDAILVGGALPDVPNDLIAQLDEGGRLVLPIGDTRGQLVVRLCRRENAVESTTVSSCNLRPLVLRRERSTSVPWLQLPNH
jgi:protein-L-isoaspartate(D-aspartate) O-methyltransferase